VTLVSGWNILSRRSVVDQPSKKQIHVFLDTFNKLSRFEGLARHTRGWGAFTLEEVEKLSVECTPVIEWLKELAGPRITKEGEDEGT
jgi:hypothetical protein